MGHCAFAVGRHIYILGGETTEGAQREVYALDTGAESIGASTLRLTPRRQPRLASDGAAE